MLVATVFFARWDSWGAGGFCDGVDVVRHVVAGKVDDAVLCAEEVECGLGS